MGHKRTGLSLALDGSEDHMLTRDAARFWRDLGMSNLRNTALAKVREGFGSGQLRWDPQSIDSLREPWGEADVGISQEGQEFHDDLADDEDCYEASDHDREEHDSASDSAPDEEAASANATDSQHVVALPDDDQAEVADAKRYASRLAQLEKMQALAKASDIPALAWHVEKEIHKLNKAYHVGSGDKGVSAVLRRYLCQRQTATAKAWEEERAANRKRRALAEDERREAKLARQAKASAVAEEQRKRQALAKLPHTFSAQSCGQGQQDGGGDKYIRNRMYCLQRLRLRSPPLPKELYEKWDHFVWHYSRAVGLRWSAAVGSEFVKEIDKIIKNLGDHLLPEVEGAFGPCKEHLKGDPEAFAQFMRKRLSMCPKEVSGVKI